MGRLEVPDGVAVDRVDAALEGVQVGRGEAPQVADRGQGSGGGERGGRRGGGERGAPGPGLRRRARGREEAEVGGGRRRRHLVGEPALGALGWEQVQGGRGGSRDAALRRLGPRQAEAELGALQVVGGICGGGDLRRRESYVVELEWGRHGEQQDMNRRVGEVRSGCFRVCVGETREREEGEKVEWGEWFV